MPSNEILARAPRRRITRFTTREEQAVRKHDTPAPYFRLEDRLCRQFLSMAATPSDFEGLKLLFPFVRGAALLKVPPTRSIFPTWIGASFSAGVDLGNAHPELLEDLLPGQELREAVRRVKTRACVNTNGGTPAWMPSSRIK